MKTLDWIVLAGTLLSIVLYGLYKGRGSANLKGYLLADRKMRWYAVALSIMATQASAITFTSTPGQAYVDGMRFVQFYFGLPLAMVILSITAVPIYHKLGVYTAYEYLEHRFDVKTRTLTSIIFLIQRGLAVGITIYAPSLVLSVMLGWDIRLTSTLIGGIIIAYTTSGGVKAVSWTHVQQMFIIMAGMVAAFVMTIVLLPKNVGFVDALHVAGGMGKLNAIDFSFDLQNRYNFWSGLIGGLFVALAYFGTDQSQVQRYLTGESVTQSRLGLLFNGLAKVPMQFFILLIGAMVFALFQFERPPIFFNPVEVQKVKQGQYAGQFQSAEERYNRALESRSAAAMEYVETQKRGDDASIQISRSKYALAAHQAEVIRAEGIAVIQANDPRADTNDTNYIFLSFVMKYLPVGLVGLLFACIFAASMSSTSGELSALATCSVVDVYRRHIRKEGEERHYLLASRISMVCWGIYAVFFAQYASRLGSLIEAVNILGSLFYGTMLAIFLIAFYLKWIGGTATFWAAFVGEIVVLSCYLFTSISWLWYNVVGCVVVVGVAVLLQAIGGNKARTLAAS
jgi:solute:Na+ symporter, SSS family